MGIERKEFLFPPEGNLGARSNNNNNNINSKSNSNNNNNTFTVFTRTLVQQTHVHMIVQHFPDSKIH